ncbi:MAG: S41 family peptidase [Pseudomonadota bacterium]
MKNSLLGATFLLLAGCAVLDPHDIVSRRIGNAAPHDGAALSAAQRQDAFDFVWQRIKDNYVDPALRGVDWQGVGARYRPLAMAAAGDDAFWHTLDNMTGELGDSHTRVMSSKQYGYFHQRQVLSLGLGVRQIEGELLVTGVAAGSEAGLAGIRAGNKLLSIDGVPAQLWWQDKRAKARRQSTAHATAASVARVLNSGDPDQPGERVTLTLERNDHSVLAVTLLRAPLDAKDSVKAVRLASGYGYLRLSGFGHDAQLHAATDAAFDAIRSTKGMLLDLRGNGGGSTAFADALASKWLSKPSAAGRVATRDGKPVSLLFIPIGNRLEHTIAGTPNAYRAPLVILIDASSASASELLASSLQGLGRAKVVGETSCGCLQTYFGYTNVPGGGALAYSEMDFFAANGKRIEGVGVLPDVEVGPSRHDLQIGRDAQLEAALALLDTLTAAAPTKEQ